MTAIAVVAEMLTTGSADHTIRLWKPETGTVEAVLRGHLAKVTSVCAVRVDGAEVLASAGLDRTVRIWDTQTGAPHRTIPIHSPALCCRQIGHQLIVGLSNGILAIELRADDLPRPWQLKGDRRG